MESQPLILSYADAARTVREHAEALNLPRPFESVSLLSALGRVLAQPVRADRDQPPFRRSTRDGFACLAADLLPDASLQVIGQIRAGEPAGDLPLSRGEAVEIMTGAPVPHDADCVVMVEHVAYDGASRRLRLNPGRSIRAGENIVPAGAEARAGVVVLPAGVRLAARHLAVAASCGCAQLEVYPRPRVAVLATGDELVEVDETPRDYQIRNSNSYSLAAQIENAGGEAIRLPIVRDTREAIHEAIKNSLDADLLLFSGGVSMGRYDLVEEVLHAHHAEFFFTGAQIQPGRPVVFGRLPLKNETRYFFGLPGNPVSTMVTFALFVEPLLAALAGQTFAGPRFVQAQLAADLRVKAGLTRFLPAVLDYNLPPQVTAVAWQGSGDVAATAASNAFLIVPPDRESLQAGETLNILLP